MKNFLLILIALIFSSRSFAWDFNHFKSELSSPFTTSAENILIYGGGATLAVLLFEDQIVDPTQREFSNDKPLGSLSKFGDLAGQLIPNAVYALTQLVLDAKGDPQANKRAVGMFKATAYSSGITNVLKYTVREPRPNSSARNSFPSGHTTSAFAFSGYVYEEHGYAWGIPAFMISGFVGASRINDNRHYLHDVLAGATIGLAYGVGISRLYRQETPGKQDGSSFFVLPLFDESTKGLTLVGEF